MSPKVPVIFGIKSTCLTKEEKDFLTKNRPIGVILFARNCQSKLQIFALIEDIKRILPYDLFILIDQEGGEVARLREPEFWSGIAPPSIGKIAKDSLEQACMFSLLVGILSGYQLFDLGINCNCTPMIDIGFDNSHNLITSRVFSHDVDIITDLAGAFSYGQSSLGIYNIIKHIPGHGRATKDSHFDLPIIKEDLQLLNDTDFKTFRSLNFLPFAMTAHILYEAIDQENIATCSPKIINLIKEEIGFKNLIMTDDISMKALSGSLSKNAEAAWQAGCDIVLHCNGNQDEMNEIMATAKPIQNDFQDKLQALKPSIASQDLSDNCQIAIASLNHQFQKKFALTIEQFAYENIAQREVAINFIKHEIKTIANCYNITHNLA